LKIILVRSRAIDPAVNKVAKTLAQNGHDVKLFVWDRMGNKHTENIDGYAIHRFGFRAPHDRFTVLCYFPIWWIYEFFFLMKNDSAVIHACDLDTLMPAIFVKLVKKVKLCYTIYDFYAGHFSDKFPHIFRKFVAFVEIFGVGFVEILFLVDECRYEEIKGAKIADVVYIYNSPPDYFINSKQRQYTGEKLNLFYAGVIHKSRGLEYVIRAIRDIDCKLTIAGIGSVKDLFDNIPIEIRSKINYIGRISYENVIEKTMESDVIFAFYDPTISNSRYASPNKLFEAMMCGKPIIMNSEIAASEIVLREKCGIIVPYGDIEKIKDAIVMLKDDYNLRKTFGENGRRSYENLYSWEIMKNRLTDVYAKLERSET
jgi:glycosyltransferase involved in cell wall biosynthesis